MKVFKVTGWAQYKTDCASKIERVQIAESLEDAVNQVVSSLISDDRTYKLSAIELLL